MKFNKLYIRNFRSIKSHTYNFEHKGLCGIMGPNGVGKSSLLLALVYNLFGKISKDIKLAEIVNWEAKGDLLTQVEFQSNGSNYTIIRSIDSTEYGTDLIIIKDGVKIRGATKSETQEILETQILGLNFDTFCSSAYFNIQSAAGSILYATEAHRRKAFNEITGLDYYDKFFSKVKDRCKDLKESLHTAKVRLEEINKSLDSDGTISLAAKVKSWESDRIANIEALRVKDSQYSLEVNKEVMEIDKKMDQLRAAISDLEALLAKEDESSREASLITAELSMIADEVQCYYRKVPEAQVLESKVEALTSELNRYNTRLANLYSEVGNLCEDCGQTVTEATLPHITEYLNNKISNTKASGAPLYDKLKSLKEVLPSQSDIDKLNTKSKELKTKLSTLTSSSKSKLLKNSLESNKVTLTSLVTKKVEVKAKPSPYKMEIELLQSQLNPYTELLEQQSKQLEVLHSRKSEATTLVQTINVDLESWELLKNYEKELKLALIQDTVTSVNSYLASFLDVLGDGKLSCEFVINDGANITISIAVREHSTSFFSLSLGQQAMLRFCTQLSFFKHIQESLGLEFPLLFLDEGLDGMDEHNKSKAADLIRATFNNLECIYIIDHDKPFLSKLDTYIEVEDDNGSSKFL